MTLQDRIIPVADIPKFSLLPDNAYDVRLALITEKQTQETGKLMYGFQWQVDFGPYEGMPLFDNCVIGSEADPDAQNPQTWIESKGAQRLMRIMDALQVPKNPSILQMAQAASGRKCTVVVEAETDPTGKYEPQNRVRRYVALGAEGAQPAAGANGQAQPATPQAVPNTPQVQPAQGQPPFRGPQPGPGGYE